MRQVPTYLIIGDGRVARHYTYYFNQINVLCIMWSRKEPISHLYKKIKQATHILLLISDKAIEPFAKEYLTNADAVLIHFSGSLVSDIVFGAHPLMCFNENLYSLAQYKQITFVIDDDAPESLMPGIPNSQMRLPKKYKAKYHALCVMSGNFSCLLWQKLFASLEKEFQLPANIANLYLQQQTENLIQNYKTALTGPLTRNDQVTIQKNLQALSNDPYQAVYESFINCYAQLQKGNL